MKNANATLRRMDAQSMAGSTRPRVVQVTVIETADACTETTEVDGVLRETRVSTATGDRYTTEGRPFGQWGA